MDTPRTLSAITARHAAALPAEITGAEDHRSGKHYGLRVLLGDNDATIWHCTDDRTHEDEAAEYARGAQPEDLYCDSHYATRDDRALHEFLINVQADLTALLPRVAELRRAARDALSHLPLHSPVRAALARAAEAFDD